MIYQPSEKILDNYANLLVNFALNSGKGIKRNEVVFLQVPESAKPLLISLQKSVLKAGAHAIIQYLPDGIMKDFFELANEEQIKFFPANFLKGKVREADHFITVIAETDLHELEGVEPQKIMERNKSLKPYIEWRNNKETKNKFTWTLGLYATSAMAKEAGLSLKDCWQQIINACYLEEANPVKKWQEITEETNRIKSNLNQFKIDKLHLVSKDTDLIIGIGENRKWCGGDGRNIPSFEIFISPDWRQTEGKIYFDQPLYRDGNLIKDIHLEFNNGIVTKATAEKGEAVLKEMVKVENANKIGEFSLTDKRMSRINKYMAETLFDENYGGKYGNTHIALGSAYKESFRGKISRLKPSEWEDMGFNDSAIHTDIIATNNREVTAILKNGKEILIYKDGKFLI
jgi:aminopeptidase